jgi:hypothetical protein
MTAVSRLSAACVRAFQHQQLRNLGKLFNTRLATSCSVSNCSNGPEYLHECLLLELAQSGANPHPPRKAETSVWYWVLVVVGGL